jgi:Ca2+-binding EF-hand superfamily protein
MEQFDSLCTFFYRVLIVTSHIQYAGNGSIEFSEFLILIASRLKTENMVEEVRDALAVFDKDKDGRLSTLDLKDVLSNIGDKISSDDINEMIAAADSRGTGVVDIEGTLLAMGSEIPSICMQCVMRAACP